jgi:hypothetical protein
VGAGVRVFRSTLLASDRRASCSGAAFSSLGTDGNQKCAYGNAVEDGRVGKKLAVWGMGVANGVNSLW